MFVPGPYDTLTHHFSHRLIALEFKLHPQFEHAQNIIIWIAGLGDGLMTVPYPWTVAKNLPGPWTIAQVLLSSSYSGWGTSSLQSDVREIAQCVTYFRSRMKEKIVLMGHSTGCQDVMEYLVGPGHESRPRIEGAILQAPVSDREALLMHMPREEYNHCVAVTQAMIAAGKGEEILPASVAEGFFGVPVSAKRGLSLLSPNHDGEDDYFSSDLSDAQLQRTFGSIPIETTLCILYSGSDEHVPAEIDKAGLVRRWVSFIKGRVDLRHSGVVERASHNLKKDDPVVVSELVRRVLGFLDKLERGAGAAL